MGGLIVWAQRGLETEIELDKGAMHGGCVLYSPVYPEAIAEKASSRTLDLFSSA
jgi:hypothetical protein